RGEWPLSFGPESFVDKIDVDKYFRALCIDPAPAELPAFQLSDEVTKRTPESWNLAVQVLGLRIAQRLFPQELARSQFEGGQRNLLFYGPPRTGKSYTAVSVAAEYL